MIRDQSAAADLEQDPAESGPPAEHVRRQVPGIVLSGAVLVFVLAAWQFTVRVFDVPIVLVPAPTDVFTALVNGLGDGSLIEHAWVTLQEILVGFGLAVVAALLCAFLVTQSRTLDKALFPLIVMTQTIPKVAMAPLLVVWFGTEMTSKVLTTALIAFFPLLINAVLGLRSADPDQVDMLRSFGASRMHVLRHLQIPSALPHIFAGLDVAVVLSVTGAIVAEFVGATAGLGYVIQATNFTLDVSRTFAVLVILSAIGLTLHAVVVLANRKIVFWSAEHRTITEQA
jgi:NitT/TauT family transport system permease protein